MMRNRRDFLAALGGAAVIPMPAPAQRRLPLIGYFSNRTPEAESAIREPFLKALGEMGFLPGRNVDIEYRFANGQESRLPALAAELLARPADLLVTTDRNSAVVAKAATADVPIVFLSGLDPIRLGLVASFSRPGGNATGVSVLGSELGPKRLTLLREMLPRPGTIAFVVAPKFSTSADQTREMKAAAQALDQELLVVDIGDEREAPGAFAMMAVRKVGAILYSANTFYQVIAARLIDLGARYRIPALYEWREFVEAGGLMSYSTSRAENGMLAGNYAARILRGERPSELPVVQSSRFELVINLKTAKAMGFEIPALLLARADEVIE